MDETPAERIAQRVVEGALALALIVLAGLRPDAMPYTLMIVSGIFGKQIGAGIASRVRASTVRKLGGGDGAAGGGSAYPPGMSAPPPPSPSKGPPAALLLAASSLAAVLLGVALVGACTSGPMRQPTLRELEYTAAQRLCPKGAESLAESRACRADVDRRFPDLVDGGQLRDGAAGVDGGAP